MPKSLLVEPQKSITDKDPYLSFVKKTGNLIDLGNLPKTSKIFVEAQGSETRSNMERIIFFLKRFMDQF